MARLSLPTIMLGALVSMAVGAIVAVFLSPTPPPREIAATAEVSSVVAREVEITDDQDATLAVSVTAERKLVTGVTGTITATTCTAGGRAESGRSGFSVNDAPIVYLSTPTPLWRDLAPGDQGPDVRSLQNELRRLGNDLSADGRFGSSTFKAVVALAKDAGAADARSWTGFPVARFAWIPAPSVETAKCSVQVGDQVAVGDDVATLPASIEAARLAPKPRDVVEGDRVVAVGDLVMSVDGAGVVTSAEDLAKLATAPAYREFAGGGAPSTSSQSGSTTAGDGAGNGIPVTYRLAQPMRVYSVPAAAVYGTQGTGGCVLAGGEPVAVTVASSQFGQSLVRAESATRIEKVSLRTSKAPRCR